MPLGLGAPGCPKEAISSFHVEGKAQLASAAVFALFAYASPSYLSIPLFSSTSPLPDYFEDPFDRGLFDVSPAHILYLTSPSPSVPCLGEISFDIQSEPPLSEPTQNIKDRPAGQNPGQRKGLAGAVGPRRCPIYPRPGGWGLLGTQSCACVQSVLEIFPAPSKPGPLL